MFDANQFIQQHYGKQPISPKPLLGLGGGALGGAGLGGLFALLSGGNVLPYAGLGGLAGGLLGGAVGAGASMRDQQAATEQALAQLTPAQRNAVMQAYGEQMHLPMKDSVLFQ